MRKLVTRRNLKRSRGFTLVELMIVVAIIGILATVVIVRYAGKTDQANAAAAKAQIAQLESVIIEFQSVCHRYPQTLEELTQKPSDSPNFPEGGYLKGGKVPNDPWGHPYVYHINGSDFEIVSLGADGKEGGTGVNQDISSKNVDGK